jgi:protein-tyrosine phosphatase
MTKFVLFVCTANMCRSPMAEGLFNKVLEAHGKGDRIIARSAGVNANDGSGATQEAVDVMAERGVDISLHRSRMITKAIVDGSMLIACMTKKHKDMVTAFFPESKNKVFMLSEIAEGKIEDVPDPVYNGIDRYRSIADLLQGYLDKMVEKV